MFCRKNDSHEFRPLLTEIEEEPLNPLGRTVFWIVIMAVIFFGGWMYFGRVDVVVTARGKVIPMGEIKILQALTTGVVSRILVKEGDFVKRDQVLMEIDPSNTGPELSSMREDAKLLELELVRLEAVFDRKPFQPQMERYDAGLVSVQQKLYDSCIARLEKQLQAKEEEQRQVNEQLGGAEAEYKRIRTLLHVAEDKLSRLAPVRDIVSNDQYAQSESECGNYRGSLAAAGHKIEELRVAARRILSEIAVIVASERNAILTEIAGKRNKLNYLQADIEKMTYLNVRQQLVAPLDGFINRLLIHTEGGVVSPAEKLISLVPAGLPLIISAQVQNKDIGFVAQEMAANIKIDTFNFQKYGTIDGRVCHVASDSVEDKELGLVYEVYVQPQATTLLVEGVAAPITTGMSVTAEIKVGKRRIIEFFIYPLIKSLNEGMSVR